MRIADPTSYATSSSAAAMLVQGENPPFSYIIVATHPESVSMLVHKGAF
jgi:hypothetical protein